MTLALQRALPGRAAASPAAASPGRTGADAGGHHAAWRRAVEHELCAAWFPATGRTTHGAGPAHPRPPDGPPRDGHADRRHPEADGSAHPPASAGSTSTPRAPGAPSVVVRPARAPAVAAAPGPRDGAAAPRGERAGETLAGGAAGRQVAPPIPAELSGLARAGVDGSLPADAAGGRRCEADARAGETAPDPVGVHAEWSADGVRVWLRAAPDLDPDLVAAELVRALLPQLAARGVRLLAVVCNGRVAWTSARRAPSSPLVLEPHLTPPQRQETP